MNLQSAQAANQVLFAQISKVDVENRLVYGRATDETPDRADEICDYESSKPHFQKWSEEASLATGGASVGNLRAMHGKVAAGKFTEIHFDDAAKAIDVVAKVVDDNEWDKVLAGVYTGFSIGGSYAKKWQDPVAKSASGRAAMRYTALPTEISLVDRPCNGSALFFEVRKADGSMEKVEFRQSSNPNNLEKGNDMKTRQEMEAELLGKGVAADDMSKMDDAAIAAKHAELCAEPAGGDVAKAEGGDQELLVSGTADEADAFVKYMADNGLSVKDAHDALVKVAELKVADANKTKMVKGLYTVRSVASLLSDMQYVLADVKYEEKSEGDGSDIGARLTAAFATLGAILVDMATEEIKEAAEVHGTASDDVMEMADKAGQLTKDAEAKLSEILAKAGARNSKSDLALIQRIHDHAASLGADCKTENTPAAKSAATGELSKVDGGAAEQLQKMQAINEEMRKSLDAMNERMAKMEGQVAPPRIVLRAVGKSADTGDLASKAVGQPVIDPVKKSDGSVDESATLFKMQFQQGGVPIFGDKKPDANN